MFQSLTVSDNSLILHIYIIISEHYHTYLLLIHTFIKKKKSIYFICNVRKYLLNEIGINSNGLNFVIGLNEAKEVGLIQAKEGRLNSIGVQIE